MAAKKPKESLVGKVFGEWTVVGEGTVKGRGFLKCECSCGTSREVHVSEVLTWNSSTACKKHHLAFLVVGGIIGNLELLEDVGMIPRYGRSVSAWRCRCSCGKVVLRLSSELKKSVKRGALASCGCSIQTTAAKNRLIGRLTTGNLDPRYLSSIKKGAKNRGLSFDVSDDYVYGLFTGKCVLSGVPIHLIYTGTIRNTDRTASLDRIDSSLGYVEGNLQWIHKDINRIKLDLKQHYFIDLCRDVVAHADRKLAEQQRNKQPTLRLVSR